MELKIQRLDPEIQVPSYAHEDDAGLDLPSREEVVLQPGEHRVIKTGLKMAIPKGYVGHVWDRSGMAAKYGMHTLAGVVDSGYRGEIGVVLKNMSEKEFKVEKGMRIAQMVIQQVLNCSTVEVDDLEATDRGEGGFGSSGMK